MMVDGATLAVAVVLVVFGVCAIRKSRQELTDQRCPSHLKGFQCNNSRYFSVSN